VKYSFEHDFNKTYFLRGLLLSGQAKGKTKEVANSKKEGIIKFETT
jgi:hypothetical protein